MPATNVQGPTVIVQPVSSIAIANSMFSALSNNTKFSPLSLAKDNRTPEYRSGTQMAVINLCPDREDQILGIFVWMASWFQFFYAQNCSKFTQYFKIWA